MIDEDVPDFIPISPSFFSFEGGQQFFVFDCCCFFAFNAFPPFPCPESKGLVNVIFILGSGFVVTPVSEVPPHVTEVHYIVQMVQGRWANLFAANERQYLQGFSFNRAEILENLDSILSHISS